MVVNAFGMIVDAVSILNGMQFLWRESVSTYIYIIICNLYCNNYLTYIWLLLLFLYIVCINASYLEKDYGISLTVTYNNFSIFNETISGNI